MYSCCCSVAKSCPPLCEPMNCSIPGYPVLHYLLEFAQTHVHWVSDAIHHLILCRPLLLLPSVFPSIRVFSSEPALWTRWSKYWSFSLNIQGWSLLGLTGLIFLLSKGLSRVFSSTTSQKHQFFNTKPSLWYNSHICTWLLKKPWLWWYELCWQSDVPAF